MRFGLTGRNILALRNDPQYLGHMVDGYIDGDHSPHLDHWRFEIQREGKDLNVLISVVPQTSESRTYITVTWYLACTIQI